jgi:hypothetical protein
MASIVQLKRSALSGKVPGTGSLNLGELALNTYDGKIFFRRSGSTDTVQEVITTNVTNTGSITITGALTAESIRTTLTASFGSLKVNDTLTVNHGETIISGSALVTSDLTILGAVNARQFNISVISSSVLFESGSSRFGNTSDDIHSFTGSVQISGSQNINGNIYVTGSIIPGVNDTFDLGSLTKQWRDLYLSSGSLYIDGTQILSSNATDLLFTTDTGQGIKFNELGTDNITLQTVDGDIELKSSGGGDILLDPTSGLISVKGNVTMQDGTAKFLSSGGNSIVFGNNLEITGSIVTTGNITATSFVGNGSGLTDLVVDLGTAQLNDVDGNNIPARSFAELYLACAVAEIVDLDFGI